ncbi:MAG: 3-phosphoshikimate 1-carboxyvinyltransferase [bacterium]
MIKIVAPADRISGAIDLPGDKSISHRALMISAIAEGESHIENLSSGLDVQSTLRCLLNLGVEIERHGQHTIVHGRGLTGLTAPERTLDVGNSGTTLRLLSGVVAGQPFLSRLSGDESIRSRPMSRIVIPLRQMGAEVSALKDEFAPLTIKGGNLRPINYVMPVASAQVKSCVLLAGLFADGRTTLQEPALTRDHTELMLVKYGASVQKEGSSISVSGPAVLQGQAVFVPGDLSAAAYFIAAAILVKDSDILIKNVGINPTRQAFLSLLCDLGANLDLINVRTVGSELMADLYVRSSALRAVSVSGAIIPQIIDEIPILAVLATQAEGRTTIDDALELRFKESDRLRSIAFNLERMGGKVTEKKDGLTIDGPVALKPAEIECFGDHRIAMSLAVAALVAGGACKLSGAECVDVSNPGFFQTLEELTSTSSREVR